MRYCACPRLTCSPDSDCALRDLIRIEGTGGNLKVPGRVEIPFGKVETKTIFKVAMRAFVYLVF